MAADPETPWWERYNDDVHRIHETGWGADVSVLSRQICELLDDVDAVFAVTGAALLVLTTHTPVDSEHIFTVTVAAGDPAVRLAGIPDCGCDACDRGSAAWLEELDRWVLSVVDGSLEVEVTADHSSIRTSFGAEGGTVQNLDQPTAFTAAPWPADWAARSIPPGIDTRHPEPRFPRTALGSAARTIRNRRLRRGGAPGSAQTYRST